MTHHHTGKITHKDMVMHRGSTGTGEEDPDASEEYCAHNKEHGLGAGMSPKGCYKGGLPTEHGGEGMASNEHFKK